MIEVSYIYSGNIDYLLIYAFVITAEIGDFDRIR